jgi:hypothetical protein
MIALHAVTPHCSRCGLPVRSSIQIRAEMADLEQEVLHAVALFESDPTIDAFRAYNSAVATAYVRFEELHLELAGDHLRCAVAAQAA